MKQFFTISVLAIMIAFNAGAQAPYSLTTQSVAYAPLSGATSANGATVWATQHFTMPMPFTCKIGNTSVNRIFTDGTDYYADTTGAGADIFQVVFASTIDRGTGTATSRSPLRYLTTGTAPNRIFKIESFGVGFAAEQSTYGTFNDSFNFQLWIYETTNVIEMHFGDSRITHPVDYFGTTGLPGFVGYGNVNFTLGLFNFAWVAAGNPASPYLDSFKNIPSIPGHPLNSWPVSGTVYRYSPINTLSVNAPEHHIIAAVYPTICSNVLHIDCTDFTATTYSVYSVSGTVTGIKGTLGQGTNDIDVSYLAKGVYLLQLQNEGKAEVYKFIVE